MWQSSSLGRCPGAGSTDLAATRGCRQGCAGLRAVGSDKSFTPPSRCARKGPGLSSLCPRRASHPSPRGRSPACHRSTAEQSITAPRPHPGKSGLPAAPHPSTGMQVTPCPSRHCHLTRGGCVCVSAPSRQPSEHGNAYCRVNPTPAQGEWESCPTLRQKLAVSTQMKLHYSELLGFSTESR